MTLDPEAHTGLDIPPRCSIDPTDVSGSTANMPLMLWSSSTVFMRAGAVISLVVSVSMMKGIRGKRERRSQRA